MNKTNSKILLREYFWPSFAVLFILALTLLVLVPKISGILKTKEEINLQKIEIGKLSAKMGELQTLSEADLVNSKDLLLEALPASKDIFYFMEVVKKLAEDNGFTIDNFDFTPGIISSESGSEVSSMKMRVTLSGSLENTQNYFEKTENFIPLLSFGDIKMSGISSLSDQINSFSLTTEINTFYYPLPKVLGKIDSPLPKISAARQATIDEIKNYGRLVFGESPLTPVTVGKENLF